MRTDFIILSGACRYKIVEKMLERARLLII